MLMKLDVDTHDNWLLKQWKRQKILQKFSKIFGFIIHMDFADFCHSATENHKMALILSIIGLHHPLDGVTNPKYKLMCFIQLTKFFCKEKKTLAFNQDRCCHLTLCLRLILFHFVQNPFSNKIRCIFIKNIDEKVFPLLIWNIIDN